MTISPSRWLGFTLSEHGIAQVVADRQRLGITETMLEWKRNASLKRQF